ncbi:MAG: site-specific tyrosine recombinase XerC, partial [Nitrospiraceae bacterium]
MPRKGARKPRPGDPTDAEGFAHRRAQFEEWLRVAHYSPHTIKERGERLDGFIAWCLERGVTHPTQLTRSLLERYQRHLHYSRQRDGRPLSVGTQLLYLPAVRLFCRWLVRQQLLLANPAADLELPRTGHSLPKAILTVPEVEQILTQCDVTTPLGLRDRAILETFYSTGMRRMELIHLACRDLDLTRGTVLIRQGKGNKDRVVPIGARAIAWLEKYLGEGRPPLTAVPDDGTLFLLQEGRPLTPAQLTARVRGYVRRAGIPKTGACHLFRHTCATLMLENGADVRYIQALLGHADLASTQVYTHV